MKTFQIRITGKTPLLMHWDNIDWADQMEQWKDDPANRIGSKAGDDRSPAWRWIGSMYHDESVVCIPGDNLMRSFMEGGAMVPVPGAKNGKTFKAQTQSGMMLNEPFWQLDAGAGPIDIKHVFALLKNTDFSAHRDAARKLGFSLLVKRAKISKAKHVRVRPKFDRWSLSGSLTVWDEQITLAVLTDVLRYAGQYKGLGDWRPGGRTPGAYGMFEATIANGQAS